MSSSPLWSCRVIEKAKIELALDEKGKLERRSGGILDAYANDS